MSAACRNCGRLNPGDARYCHHDGVPLPGTKLAGPLDHARTPFTEPLPFPSGVAPRNLDQLALACQNQWDEARTLLQQGVLADFLQRQGRADLAAAACVAAGADLDQALDYLLSRLPSPNLTAPRLEAAPAAVDLGQLAPGTEASFELRLMNRGHRLITGSVSSDCPWLQIEGGAGRQPRLVQFAHETTVRVRLPAPMLMAAMQPWRGQLFVETNAGSVTVPVSCSIPIVPFPHGVLQGARTPRELAEAAKRQPHEAADLFSTGAVKSWYEANGWTYPVEGAAASGVAALQQYFEALGLARPPRVVLDTPALAFQGAPGARLSQAVHCHAEESRAVYLAAGSTASWLTIAETTSQGNHAAVIVDVVVPDTPGQRLRTHLRLRANGNQRFDVPVVVQVLGAPAQDFIAPITRGASWGRRLAGATLLLGLGAILAFVCVVLYQHFPLGRSTPLTANAAAIGPGTSAVLHLDLAALRGMPGSAAEFDELATTLAAALGDLGLQGESARVQQLLFAYDPGQPLLQVWTLRQPAVLRNVLQGRFEPKALSKTRTIYIDRIDRTRAWASDERGRLLHGPIKAVEEALRRGRQREWSPRFETLSKASAQVPAHAPAWAVLDLADKLGADIGLGEARPQLACVALRRRDRDVTLQAWGSFTTSAEAAACRDRLVALPDLPLPFVRTAEILAKMHWEQQDLDLAGRVGVSPASLQSLAQAATADRVQAQRRQGEALDKLCQEELARGRHALKFDDYATAASAFGRAVELFPGNAEAKQLWEDARRKHAEKQAYRQGLEAVRTSLAAGKLAQARTQIAQIKAGPHAARDVQPLESDLVAQERAEVFRGTLRDAEDALRREEFVRAKEFYDAALHLRSDDSAVKQALAGIARVQEVESCLARAEKEQAGGRIDETLTLLRQAIALLTKDAKAWQVGPLPRQRERLTRKAVHAYQGLQRLYLSRADQAHDDAELARLRTDFARSATEYARAIQQVETARAIAEELTRSDVGVAKSTLRPLDERLTALRQEARQAEGESFVVLGRRDLLEARGAYGAARMDATRLAGARARADSAVKRLREAEKRYGADVANLLREAEALAGRYERLAQPIEYNFNAGPPPETWRYRKDQWEQRAGPDGVGILQAARVPSASIQSDLSAWPFDFELEVVFAMMTPAGKINNQLWEHFADPLTLALVSDEAGGEPVVLRVGKDPTLPLQNSARLALGKESNSIQELIRGNEPITLLLQCKRQVLTVSVNGRRLRSVPARHGFGQFRIEVANPYNANLSRYVAFPALYRITLRPLAGES